jgi:hypothetical protein
MQYIFPPPIQENRANYDNLALKYCDSEGLDIAGVKAERVLSVLEEFPEL